MKNLESIKNTLLAAQTKVLTTEELQSVKGGTTKIVIIDEIVM